jgi:cellulose synthase (UDP-forming)
LPTAHSDIDTADSWRYDRYTDIAGPLTAPVENEPTVRYRPVLTGRQRWILAALVLLNAIFAVAFIGWLVRPSHMPLPQDGPRPFHVLAIGAYGTLILLELVRVAQNSTL